MNNKEKASKLIESDSEVLYRVGDIVSIPRVAMTGKVKAIRGNGKYIEVDLSDMPKEMTFEDKDIGGVTKKA